MRLCSAILMAGVLILLIAACVELPQFVCPDADYCDYQGKQSGHLCIFDGRYGTSCAFPDSDCPSGYRWGVAGRPTGSGCVLEAYLPDALPADGGATGPADGGDPR